VTAPVATSVTAGAEHNDQLTFDVGAQRLDGFLQGVRLMRIVDEHRGAVAVADQIEVRDVAKVEIRLDRERSLTLLFDPEHALDERIAMEQFAT